MFLVASCSTPQSSNQNGSNQGANIEIQMTGTESKEVRTETIPQQNCTGSAEVENSTEKSRTIEYVMEVQNGASINANGQVGFAGTDVELGATVASQLGLSYGTSETLTRSITVKASVGTNMQHTIRELEIWKVGQAKISVGGQETIIPFKFRSDFAVELVNSQDLGCPSTGTQPEAQPQPTQASNNSQQNQCQWLQSNFPQTADDAKAKYNLPSDTSFQFIYELCPSIANAFAFKANSTVEIQVPSGGCIDS
jgi:hypothetical protein